MEEFDLDFLFGVGEGGGVSFTVETFTFGRGDSGLVVSTDTVSLF